MHEDRDRSTVAVLEEIRNTPLLDIDIESEAIKRVLDRFRRQLNDTDAPMMSFNSFVG